MQPCFSFIDCVFVAGGFRLCGGDKGAMKIDEVCGRPYDPSRALSKPFIQPRVQGRNPARFKGGYGVPRGFKGEKFEISP